MNEEKLEKAARKLCELRGLDPDERVGHGHPDGYAVMLYSPRWKLVAGEIESTLQVLEAIDSVKE